MNCFICGQLVTLGVFVNKGQPENGMICWPCVLEGEEE